MEEISLQNPTPNDPNIKISKFEVRLSEPFSPQNAAENASRGIILTSHVSIRECKFTNDLLKSHTWAISGN